MCLENVFGIALWPCWMLLQWDHNRLRATVIPLRSMWQGKWLQGVLQGRFHTSDSWMNACKAADAGRMRLLVHVARGGDTSMQAFFFFLFFVSLTSQCFCQTYHPKICLLFHFPSHKTKQQLETSIKCNLLQTSNHFHVCSPKNITKQDLQDLLDHGRNTC